VGYFPFIANQVTSFAKAYADREHLGLPGYLKPVLLIRFGSPGIMSASE